MLKMRIIQFKINWCWKKKRKKKEKKLEKNGINQHYKSATNKLKSGN